MSENVIAVIGLGYVGLPLAVEFGKKYTTIGYDINLKRVNELNRGIDHTRETDSTELSAATKLIITSKAIEIEKANIYIITVPTPVDQYNNPDLSIIKNTSEIVGKYLKQGDIVIYESTVYPGVTEEICVPILEGVSKLLFNIDFFCGYSPERINPGDKTHTLKMVRKITSGSTPETAKRVDELYASIITAGTFMASSIKVAEAAKVIENAQRDINIAFVNELAKIFNLLKIDTNEVLCAASTKWNFLPFKPGLVGGHCIGVDPFYLAQKAKEVGYHTEIILAGRRMNDSMAEYISDQFVRLMIKNNCLIKGNKVLILGVTFKENCPDIRNSKVFGIIRVLKGYDMDVVIYDPWADPKEVLHECGLNLSQKIEEMYSGVLICVAHQQFKDMPYKKWKNSGSIIYDVKGILPIDISHGRL